MSKEKGSRIVEESGAKKKDHLPEPVGLSYFSQLEGDDSSSEEGEVPLTYYEKEFRGLIRSQALEETNFLYFSRNESMGGWT
jgi:hypothetical protein